MLLKGTGGRAGRHSFFYHKRRKRYLFMYNLRQQPVLVLGAGLSGVAAARLAAREGALVTLLDEASPDRLAATFQQLEEQGVRCCGSWQKSSWPKEAALAIISPGISLRSPLGQLAASLSCPVLSELSFGAQYCQCPLLAITGSNGKTTAIEMLASCLKAAGVKAIAGGNIGLPLSQLALQAEGWDYIAVEVSSFQLEYAVGFQPDAAALLNISPDHLDRHETIEVYRDLKLRLLRQSKEKGTLAIKAELLEDPVIAESLKKRSSITFSAAPDAKADFCCRYGAIGRWNAGQFQPLLDCAKLLFSGSHNYENAMSVLALLEALPVDQKKAIQALRTFHCGQHRLEKIAEVNGVKYVNDSKATNVDALIKALEYCGDKKRKKIILIAGGVDKGCALQEAKSSLKMYVKQVLLIGACRERLAQAWSEDVSILQCPDFNSAMAAATAAAREGDTVLLSPGCASFDMFKDYGHRGQSFVEFVEKLKKESKK
jgi:UDP-N-acetylmuramoylalanine--D-glutamate ligase